MPKEGDRFDHERHEFYSPLSQLEMDRLRFVKGLINRDGLGRIDTEQSWIRIPRMTEQEVPGSAHIEYRVLKHFAEAAKSTKVALEAGHIYVDPTMSPLGEQDRQTALSGAALGGRIHDLLSRNNIPVSKWVFVDDLHVNGGATDPANAMAAYARYGFKPDFAVLESDPQLNATALGLIERIHEVSPNRLVTMRKGYSLRPTNPDEPNILLADRTKGKEPIHPKCSALDAALTLQKVGFLKNRFPEGEVACINVLPEIYAPQQVNTREILAAAGYSNIFLMSVLYNDETPTYSVSGNFQR